MTIQQALAQALQHHQSGRLAAAEALYRQLLAVQPRQADALHLLGVLAQQVGRHEVAVDLIGQALAVEPNHPDWHSNLGEAHRQLGQRDEAIAAYRQATSRAGRSRGAIWAWSCATKEHSRKRPRCAAGRSN